MKDPFPVERITLKSIGENILSVLNLEKGFFYTVNQFFFKPSQATQDYLFTRKRKLFVKPISLLLLVTGAVVFAILKISAPDIGEEMMVNIPEGVSVYWQKVLNVIGLKFFEYINIIQLLSVPAMGLLSFLFFGSKTYNLAEHLVISAYIASIHGILYLLIVPAILYDEMFMGLTLVLLGYYYYAFMSIFDCKNGKGFLMVSILLALRSLLLGLIMVLAFAIYFWFYPMQ